MRYLMFMITLCLVIAAAIVLMGCNSVDEENIAIGYANIHCAVSQC